MEKYVYVVISGDPFNGGYTLEGVFSDADEAHQWAEQQTFGESDTYWVSRTQFIED